MRAKEFALGFGIAIIFPMMVHYGVSTFVPKPNWQDYQIENYYEKYRNANPEEQKELELERHNLMEERKKAERRFQRSLFFIAVPLGIIAIIAGALLSIQSIGTGLMFGGIFTVCDGYFNYWYELDDSLKFVSLIVTFIVLIVIGYKKLEGKE